MVTNMSFLDTIQNEKGKSVRLDSLQEHIDDMKRKENQKMLNYYAEHIVSCVKGTLISAARAANPNARFSFDGFALITFPSDTYDQGIKEYHKYVLFEETTNFYSEIKINLSINALEILNMAKAMLAVDGIKLLKYCALFEDNKMYDIPFKISYSEKLSHDSSQWKVKVKSTKQNGNIGIIDHHPNFCYKLGVYCSFCEE